MFSSWYSTSSKKPVGTMAHPTPPASAQDSNSDSSHGNSEASTELGSSYDSDPVLNNAATQFGSRFKKDSYPCEWKHSYVPGSYHPIDLGDLIKDGQFKVVRKLGYSSRCTVWLARNEESGACRAIKIMRADDTDRGQYQVDMYRQLQQLIPASTLDRHFVKIFDTFEQTSCNGTHMCIEMEPMAADGNQLLEHYRGDTPGQKSYIHRRFSVRVAKRVMRDSLEAVKILHENGFLYGGLHQGNMLFGLSKNLDNETEETLRQPANVWDDLPDSISEPLERVDGQIDPWCPKHVYVPKQLVNSVDIGPNMHVKIGDLGGGKSWSSLAYYLLVYSLTRL